MKQQRRGVGEVDGWWRVPLRSAVSAHTAYPCFCPPLLAALCLCTCCTRHQAVETDYIGAPVGNLDQIMILFAKEGMGMLS